MVAIAMGGEFSNDLSHVDDATVVHPVLHPPRSRKDLAGDWSLFAKVHQKILKTHPSKMMMMMMMTCTGL
jgi:phosphoribosylcarboxyaminoimidazole (NCAIR) mutase